MSDPVIKLDPGSVEALVHKAILEQIGEEARDKLIEGALRYLITQPQGGGYGPKVSPLQQAFNNALTAAANQVAMDLVATSPKIKERINELLGETLGALMGHEGYDEAAESLASAFTGAVRQFLRNTLEAARADI